MSLCPEAAKRDAMTDAEFWDWAFNRNDAPEPESDDYDEVDALPFGTLSPCPECGEMGPCAYDDDGRPMIHVVNAEVDA